MMAKTALYIGTYTAGEGKGILAFDFSEKDGSLTAVPGSPFFLENASYLTASADGRFLYAVIENETYCGRNGGGVAVFAVDRPTGSLRLINTQPTAGRAPCHLSADSRNEYLLAANYNEGTLSVFPLAPDGSIRPRSSVETHTGCGADPERQEQAHAHFVRFTPDGRFVCSVDLGIDAVQFYALDRANGRLVEQPDRRVDLAPGAGPRHLAIGPKGFAYIVTELSSQVAVARFTEDDRMEIVDTVSALPAGFAGRSACAAIRLSPDGRFLYVSNRGHDSIAVFAVDGGTGRLTPVEWVPSGGKFPRDIALDPSGKWLLAANQNSGTVTSFSVDRRSGRLTKLARDLAAPEAVCVFFLPLD